MAELRIVIIGGVAGGMSAATRARRLNEHASIIVLEKGPYVSFANCGLPYFVAGRIESKDKLLVTTADLLRRRFNIDARVHHEATGIDRAARTVSGIDHSTGRRFTLPYDKLILAPGASPILPPIDHLDSPNVFLMRTIPDALAVRGYIAEHRPRTAAVVGAGFIGLEMAEALRDQGLDVILIEKAPHVLPPLDPELAPWIEQELTAHGVRLFVNAGLKSLIPAGSADAKTENQRPRIKSVVLEDGRSIPADLVLLSIGVRPNVELARGAGLSIGASGAIAVDHYLRTSDPAIYAVGDAAEVVHGVTGKPVRIPLAGPANRHGRTAGEHAATGCSRPAASVLGTAVVGVFDLTAAVTGLSEAAARAAGFEVETAYVHPGHHAGYYPGAQPMHLKLIYDRASGRVLGAQAVGGQGVDKRIDVIAAAIHFKGTVDDLTELDLAYAPQYGSAKDPVHMAGFVAQNQLRGLSAGVSTPLDGELLLDVRTPREVAAGALPGAVSIPVDELRQRLGELDRSRPITIYCQVGLRGYVAERILRQHGFTEVRNLKGGYLMSGRRRENRKNLP